MSDSDLENQILARRQFFSTLFGKAAKPIAKSVEQRMERLQRAVNGAAREPLPSVPPDPPLRPPGAREEFEFQRLCRQCDYCGESCPADAILIDPESPDDGRDFPWIEPAAQACVVCESAACMESCPSGALRPTPRESFRMGFAEILYDLCLRTDGEDCRECVRACPRGEDALVLNEGDVRVEPGCVGCGVCAMVCPTTPLAVEIHPRPLQPLAEKA